MLIRGPRFSGKTSMCELLEKHLKEIITENDRVISISNLLFKFNSHTTYDDFWKSVTGKIYWEWQESFPNGLVYIIMDETQLTYSHNKFVGFWNWVRGEQKNKNTNIRLIMFAVYPVDSESGDISMELAPITASPIHLHHKYGARLLMSRAGEHNELMDDFSRKLGWGEAMTETVRDAIVDLVAVRSDTTGEDKNTRSCHLGLIRRILHFIYERHNPTYGIPPPTEVDILKYLTSSALFEHVRDHRGAVHLYKFNKEEEEILREVVLNDFIIASPMRENYRTIASLCKAGYLHFIDKDCTQDYVADSGRVGFLTNYVYIMCFTKLSEGKKEVIPIDRDQFENFLMESIRRLDAEVVENSLGVLRRKGDSRLLAERSWQMEFYRTAYSCLPSDYYISPDVGATFGIPGRLNFYVDTGLNWAVELAAEGDDIPGHVARFEQENKYKNIPHSKNIVLDFRMGTTIRKLVHGAWHLLYDKSSRTFTIKRLDEEDQLIKLSKCKIGFTIRSGDETEKLFQEALSKKAIADIKKADAEIKKADADFKKAELEAEEVERKRKRAKEEEELEQQERMAEKEEFKLRQKRAKEENLKLTIKYWQDQGNLDNVAKYRKQLDELMND
ncbi:uncharacterized protein VTP21DRAFT_3729 [Calcarisporiella thermophila]|uniref:uncharacterized protein n=1 Tax=Calcarisporiella thermophila TaxID=911321 RepID=UPI00374377DC